MDVTPGMTRAQLISIMGTPSDRSFRENQEALGWCDVKFEGTDWQLVWLEDGLVVGLTNYRSGGMFCAGSALPVDWGQFPADRIIEIRNR